MHTIDDTKLAQRLHQRHGVGALDAGRLQLHACEAAWLAFSGRDEGQLPAASDILREAGHKAEVDYLVYADLRERGRGVRVAETHLEVLPRGAPSDADAEFHVYPVAERDALDAAWLAALQGVVAVVDDDGQMTYYQTGAAEPRGDTPIGALPTTRGVMLADRVLVADPVAATKFWSQEWLGTRHAHLLFLSFTEAAALARRGVLDLPTEVARLGADQQDFARVLAAYEDLRGRGVVAKAGLRFGTHLRGYRTDPSDEHAEWLIHCTGADSTQWVDLARGVRLAHGVRKKFLLAFVQDRVSYIEVTWFKP